MVNFVYYQAQISLELTYHPPDGSIREALFGIPPSNHGIYGDSLDGIDTKFSQPGKFTRRGSRMSLPGTKSEQNGGLHGSLLSLPTPSQKKNKYRYSF